jgi:hypothetical protein
LGGRQHTHIPRFYCLLKARPVVFIPDQKKKREKEKKTKNKDLLL